MNDSILLHPQTGRQVEALLKNPAHAVMIIGPAGAGKQTLGRFIAARMLEVPPAKLQNQPYYLELNRPDGKSEIPIEAVRGIIKGLRLKTAGRRRIVLINEAHFLSEEAQNALLKAIEEPPDNTVFLITVTARDSVLPTIASRSRKLNVFPAGKKQTRAFFKEFEERQVNSAWSLARGYPGLSAAILQESDTHEVRLAVEQAKIFLRMDRFERVIYLDKQGADKQQFAVFLDALSRVYAALSDAAIASENKRQLMKLTASRLLLANALESLNKNTAARLIGLDLALSLSI